MRLLRTVLTRPEGSTQRDKMKPGFKGKKKETKMVWKVNFTRLVMEEVKNINI